MRQDARVDLLEMKTYAEVDVAETPIVVLGCGHFFTAETLDGLIGLHDVYVTDKCGRFAGLADVSGDLASRIPQCPDCQCPVRQYVTQRYNRVINRAVMDEMSKRFLVSGKEELNQLEIRAGGLETEFEKSRSDIIRSIRLSASIDSAGLAANVRKQVQSRHKASRRLTKEISLFLQNVADRHQPARKLHAAMVHATQVKNSRPLDETLASLNISDVASPIECDRRVVFGGRMVQIRVVCAALEDNFSITDTLIRAGSFLPERATKSFLKDCAKFIGDCGNENLPKLKVEATLYFSRIARIYRSSPLPESDDQKEATAYVSEARDLLENALEICKQPFQNAEILKQAVEDSIKLLGRQWYEKVTPEELAVIKQAMVSGPKGIATHSGHWYNCINGHPFAIGECGMPMEQARCPECGARIGGSNHQAVEGVTRAMNMESH